MTREIIDITDEASWLELRKADITSTSCATIFGKGKYQSYYSLWQEKHRGIAPEFKPTDRTEAGKHLEKGIASFIVKRFELGGFSDFDQYIRVPAHRIGASFDFLLDSGEILEIKNVDQWEFKDGWNADEVFDIVPPHIEYQCQHQMYVAEKPSLVLGVLVGGNTPYIFRRTAEPGFAEEFERLADEFWNAPEPKPDYEKDAQDVIKVHQLAEPGKEYEITDEDERLLEVLQGYKDAAEEEKDAKGKKSKFKAEALVLIGEAERAKGNGFTVTARTVSPKEVPAYEKKGYRDFRVYQRDR